MPYAGFFGVLESSRDRETCRAHPKRMLGVRTKERSFIFISTIVSCMYVVPTVVRTLALSSRREVSSVINDIDLSFLCIK